MIKGYCKVSLLGRVGSKHELKSVNNFTYIEFSVAITVSSKDVNGEWINNTQWYNVKAYNKLADTIAHYVNKGDLVALECVLKENKWVDKDTGQNRSILVLIANEIQFTSTSGHKNSVDKVAEAQSMTDNKDMPHKDLKIEFEDLEDDFLPFA